MAIVRINQLPDGSGTLSNDDILILMDNPSGGGTTKKISISELSSIIGGGGGGGPITASDITDFNASVSGLWPTIIDGGSVTGIGG